VWDVYSEYAPASASSPRKNLAASSDYVLQVRKTGHVLVRRAAERPVISVAEIGYVRRSDPYRRVDAAMAGGSAGSSGTVVINCHVPARLNVRFMSERHRLHL
jgi:hypothetical protein